MLFRASTFAAIPQPLATARIPAAIKIGFIVMFSPNSGDTSCTGEWRRDRDTERWWYCSGGAVKAARAGRIVHREAPAAAPVEEADRVVILQGHGWRVSASTPSKSLSSNAVETTTEPAEAGAEQEKD
jgi:hypothetical protein